MVEGEVITEYRSCVRCGMTVRADRLNRECDDCKGLDRFVPINFRVNNQITQYAHTDFAAIDAGYEIGLHYYHRTEKCPTRGALNLLGLPYVVYRADPDPFEVAYAMGLHEGGSPIEYPIVLVTSHGEYLEHWEGFRLDKLSVITARRNAALGIEDVTEQGSLLGVPIELKVAA